MAEIKYEVVQRIAVLSQRPRGWVLTKVSFAGAHH